MIFNVLAALKSYLNFNYILIFVLKAHKHLKRPIGAASHHIDTYERLNFPKSKFGKDGLQFYFRSLMAFRWASISKIFIHFVSSKQLW